MRQAKCSNGKIMLILLLSMACASCALFPWNKKGAMTVDNMKALIAQELPLGVPKEKVVEFLDNRGIHHANFEYFIEYDSAGSQQRLPMLTASLENNASFFGESKLYLVFYFNTAECLARYEVKQTHKAP